MKIFNLVILCLVASTITAIGQNSFTLSQLIDFANCEKLSCFDTKARKSGYSWKNSPKVSVGKGYYYEKIITTDKYEFINGLHFTDHGDGKPTISFTVSSDLKENYFIMLKEQAAALRFIETENSPTTENGKLWLLYKNSSYTLGLGEKPQLTNKGNKYSTYMIYVIRL